MAAPGSKFAAVAYPSSAAVIMAVKFAAAAELDSTAVMTAAKFAAAADCRAVKIVVAPSHQLSMFHFMCVIAAECRSHSLMSDKPDVPATQ